MDMRVLLCIIFFVGWGACVAWRLTVRRSGLLVRHQHGRKLLQLVPPDDAVQVHLLQDAVRGKLLAALILEEGGEHAGALLACAQGKNAP